MQTKHKTQYSTNSLLNFFIGNINFGTCNNGKEYKTESEIKLFINLIKGLFHTLKSCKNNLSRYFGVRAIIKWKCWYYTPFLVEIKDSDLYISFHPSSFEDFSHFYIEKITEKTIDYFKGLKKANGYFSSFDKIIQFFEDFDFPTEQYDFIEKLKQYCDKIDT